MLLRRVFPHPENQYDIWFWLATGLHFVADAESASQWFWPRSTCHLIILTIILERRWDFLYPLIDLGHRPREKNIWVEMRKWSLFTEGGGDKSGNHQFTMQSKSIPLRQLHTEILLSLNLLALKLFYTPFICTAPPISDLSLSYYVCPQKVMNESKVLFACRHNPLMVYLLWNVIFYSHKAF